MTMINKEEEEGENKESALLKELVGRIEAYDDDDGDGEEDSWLKRVEDVYLLRFLRGHKYDMEETWEYLIKTNRWRKEYNMGTFLEDWKTTTETQRKFLREYWPLVKLGENAKGGPVALYRMARVDFPQIVKHVKHEYIPHPVVARLEESWRNYPLGHGTLILDLGYSKSEQDNPVNSVLGVQSFVRALVKAIKLIAPNAAPNFPETFDHILVVRPPGIFAAVWKIVQFFVEERTREKVKVRGGDPVKHLGRFLSQDLIPSYLGGENTTPIPHAGKLSDDFLNTYVGE